MPQLEGDMANRDPIAPLDELEKHPDDNWIRIALRTAPPPDPNEPDPSLPQFVVDALRRIAERKARG